MASFQERIKSTLKRGEAAKDGPIAGFDKVLHEFVATLVAEEPYLGAAIEPSHQPQMRSFVTWPRYRSDERSIMLSFWWDGTTMRVLNEKERAPFATPEELSDYLVDFLANSAFPATLAVYAERCREKVDGYLRTKGVRESSESDVMVLVSPDDQKRIAEARSGEDVELEVEAEPIAGTREYDPKGGYLYMDAGGFGLSVLMHWPADGRIKIKGQKLAEAQPT